MSGKRNNRSHPWTAQLLRIFSTDCFFAFETTRQQYDNRRTPPSRRFASEKNSAKQIPIIVEYPDTHNSTERSTRIARQQTRITRRPRASCHFGTLVTSHVVSKFNRRKCIGAVPLLAHQENACSGSFARCDILWYQMHRNLQPELCLDLTAICPKDSR